MDTWMWYIISFSYCCAIWNQLQRHKSCTLFNGLLSCLGAWSVPLVPLISWYHLQIGHGSLLNGRLWGVANWCGQQKKCWVICLCALINSSTVQGVCLSLCLSINLCVPLTISKQMQEISHFVTNSIVFFSNGGVVCSSLLLPSNWSLSQNLPEFIIHHACVTISASSDFVAAP